MKKTIALVAALLAAGCASYDGRGLLPGKSSATDVEKLMGRPAERVTLAGGDSVWFYPRNPFGLETYAARISPQGTLVSLDQRLTVENLRRLVIGVSTSKDVRELLGPPWRITRAAFGPREVWHYRMDNGYMIEHNLAVQISPDLVVREVLLLRDPKYDVGDPRG
jgi:hypothetical protein